MIDPTKLQRDNRHLLCKISRAKIQLTKVKFLVGVSVLAVSAKRRFGRSLVGTGQKLLTDIAMGDQSTIRILLVKKIFQSQPRLFHMMCMRSIKEYKDQEKSSKFHFHRGFLSFVLSI